MNDSRTRLTDPDEIVRAFQKRQKRMVMAAMGCFALIAFLGIAVRGVHPIHIVIVILAILFALFAFYLLTYRCPACEARVQQRMRGIRMPVRCGQCKALLDPV